MPLIAATISLVFFFPILFITVVFRRNSADKVYKIDLSSDTVSTFIPTTSHALPSSGWWRRSNPPTARRTAHGSRNAWETNEVKKVHTSGKN